MNAPRLTWGARCCLLVSILFLRTADAFRAIERRMHGATHWLVMQLIGLGVSTGVACHLYSIDTLTRRLCAAATVVAYRWCNWWRHRGLLRQEQGAEASNVKGIGAWSAAQKHQR